MEGPTIEKARRCVVEVLAKGNTSSPPDAGSQNLRKSNKTLATRMVRSILWLRNCAPCQTQTAILTWIALRNCA